ncbi:MAG: hypothetical protein NTX59_12435 [Elusimicrobia bacterium]|nr:hypothetical protein [Elusimicrobiota bacterium]
MKNFFSLLFFFLIVPFFFSFLFSPAAVSASGDQIKTRTGVLFTGLKAPATNYLKLDRTDPAGIAYGDFDEFSNINDPLYREGSKEFLKSSVLSDKAVKTLKAVTLRDAPADPAGLKKQNPRQKNKPVLKKRKTVKPLQIDPLKSKNTI